MKLWLQRVKHVCALNHTTTHTHTHTRIDRPKYTPSKGRCILVRAVPLWLFCARKGRERQREQERKGSRVFVGWCVVVMGCRLLFDSWPCFRLSVLCQKKKTTTVSVEIVQLAKSDLRGYGRIRPCIHHICPDFYPILKLVSTCCMIAARTHDFPFSVSHTSFLAGVCCVS